MVSAVSRYFTASSYGFGVSANILFRSHTTGAASQRPSLSTRPCSTHLRDVQKGARLRELSHVASGGLDTGQVHADLGPAFFPVHVCVRSVATTLTHPQAPQRTVSSLLVSVLMAGVVEQSDGVRNVLSYTKR